MTQTADAHVGHAPMRTRLLSLLLRPTAPPVALGLVVAGTLVAVETLVLYPLKQIAPVDALGVVYLIGVVLVSLGWGFWLAAATSVPSALAFDYFHIPPPFSLTLTQAEDGVELAIFLVVALLASTLANMARSCAAEADGRRREADLAAELARLMLYASDLHSALDCAGRRLAQVLGLGFAALEMEAVPADERHCAIPLRDGATQLGTLLIPADLPKPMQRRLRERVVPSLELVLGAARDRDATNTALEESRKELERFFDLSSDLLGIGHPAYWKRINRAFETTFGYPSQELLSRSFLDFVHPADLSLVRQVLDELQHGQGLAQFEHRIIGSDGSVRWLEWSVVPDHGLLYVAGRDVTERRRERDRLVAAQRMIEATRDEFSVLAEQQAALRRVATLVARGVKPSEVFSAVARESASCLGVYHSVLWRYQPDGAATLLAACDDDPGLTKMPVGARFSLEGDSVAAMVLRTGRAARMDSFETAPGPAAARFRDLGLRVAVGAPIVVDGRLWGAAVVGSSRPEPLPPDTEARISDFTDLVATAIANAQTRAELQASREELRGLAEQQAALRRVATLVARGVSPSEVFSAVADEMARCLHAANATVSSFEDDTVTIVAVAALTPGFKHAPHVGARHTLLEGDNIATRVFHTGRAARLDGWEFQNAPGWVAAWLRKTGLRSTVAVPIIVDGRLWGTAALGSLRPEPLPPDTETRMGDFADLVATAIANAATRADLIASRARIVAAGDEARRRIERDLHDGAQQRLVSLGLQLRVAEACVPPELHQLKEQISDTVRSLAEVSEEVQEISRGIHPANLSKGGLGPALKALARRSTVPVELDLDLGADRRLLETTEVGAYYVAAEALTNAAKHARASVVTVRVDTDGANLRLSIRDDGIGGADTANGSGLVGLVDRVEALGGQMTISSQPGNGTSLHVAIPRETQRSRTQVPRR